MSANENQAHESFIRTPRQLVVVVVLSFVVASPAAAAGPAAKAATLSVDGKKVYEATCVACHAAGVANAPKFGDKAAWAMHLMHGVGHLHENALKGIRAMPPKGGNLALSDAEVRAAVDYMVGAVK